MPAHLHVGRTLLSLPDNLNSYEDRDENLRIQLIIAKESEVPQQGYFGINGISLK